MAINSKSKKMNPMVGIVGGLFAVLLLFAIIAVLLYPGPIIHLDEGAVDGDTLFLNYKGSFDNGTVFDSSEGRQPLEVVLGEHKVVKGFEKALYGLKKGDTKTFRIPPEEAYPYNPDLVIAFNKTDVVDSLGSVPEIGEEIMVSNGLEWIQGVVVEITETAIVVDFNPPVAGYHLTFEITVVDHHKGSGGGHH
ncbi:MAG: FKBP-type peptidyl-prolyl cis-trans isomerase [Methanimicrococcus sp.]|nr:FKBP-type peptidyl-prolyl cis-trans isomerase [Methanimicrococcus sp.]